MLLKVVGVGHSISMCLMIDFLSETIGIASGPAPWIPTIIFSGLDLELPRFVKL